MTDTTKKNKSSHTDIDEDDGDGTAFDIPIASRKCNLSSGEKFSIARYLWERTDGGVTAIPYGTHTDAEEIYQVSNSTIRRVWRRLKAFLAEDQEGQGGTQGVGVDGFDRLSPEDFAPRVRSHSGHRHDDKVAHVVRAMREIPLPQRTTFRMLAHGIGNMASASTLCRMRNPLYLVLIN